MIMNTILITKLLKSYCRELAIVTLSLILIASFFIIRDKSNEIDLIQARHELIISDIKLNNEKALSEIQNENIKRYQKAIETRDDGLKQIADDYSTAITANSELHDTISNIETLVKQDNANARADYISSLGQLSKECTSEYLKMAEIADRHANDYRTLREYIGK